MLEFLAEADSFSRTVIVKDPLKKDHDIIPLGSFKVLTSIPFCILTKPRQPISYICERNSYWASYLSHLTEISLTLFLVAGLWFFLTTPSLRSCRRRFS